MPRVILVRAIICGRSRANEKRRILFEAVLFAAHGKYSLAGLDEVHEAIVAHRRTVVVRRRALLRTRVAHFYRLADALAENVISVNFLFLVVHCRLPRGYNRSEAHASGAKIITNN